MRKWLVIVLVGYLASGTFAAAQAPVTVDSIRVDIWPEFDRPAVLVIYHISLNVGVPLPLLLEIQIPSQAELNAVALVNPDFALVNAEYSLDANGEWTTLEIKVLTNEIQVEYYDVLKIDGNIREISYLWPGDLVVDNFNIVFQKPAGAKDLLIIPPATSSQFDQYDLMNYLLEPVSLADGEIYSFFASYEKSDDQLSVSSLPVQPVTPLEGTTNQMEWNDVLPWIVGGFGVLLIILGLFVLLGFLGGAGWRTKSGYPGKDGVNIKSKEKKPRQGKEVHCHECGRLAQLGDKYCRSCGTFLYKK